MKSNKAFTLIELLVVVLIIGILAAIAVPQYKVAVMKTRFATLKSLTKSIAEAEEVYYLANGNYTTHMENLDIQAPTPDDSDVSDQYGNYIYPWGPCQIEVITDTVQKVACRLNQGETLIMGYTQYMNNSQRYPRETHCVSYNGDETSIQYKICQLETSLSTPTSVDSGHSYQTWKYQN